MSENKQPRYIDADALLDTICSTPNKTAIGAPFKALVYVVRRDAEIIHMINEAPTADVAPIEYAEWIGVSPDTDTRQCSKCGYNVPSHELVTPYCPWCGRRMSVKVYLIED